MNKTLEKIVSKVAKPVLKAAIPIVLMLASYQANAQNTRGPEKWKYDHKPFVVLNEQERTLNVRKNISPYNSDISENVPYTLDVLTVKGLPNGKIFTVLYPGDLTWNKGDTIKVDYVVHKDGSRKWTDEELVSNRYVNSLLSVASDPTNAGFYDAVITELKDVKPGNGN